MVAPLLVDWSAAVSLLLERSAQPTLILDQQGTIVFLNSPVERILEAGRDQLINYPLEKRLPAGERERWQARFSEAIRGALPRSKLTLSTLRGCMLDLSVEFSLVGRGDSLGLIIAITEWAVSKAKELPPSTGEEFHYEVSAQPQERGVLKRIWGSSKEPFRSSGKPCYQELYQETQPCRGCPLFSNVAQAPPQPLIVPVAQKRLYRLVHWQTSTEQTSTMLFSVRQLEEVVVSRLLQTKLHQIGEHANLSIREQQVFEQLVIGRSIDAISTLIGISARTVKHHQANILKKLGVESRLDLMRFFFA